MMNIKNRRAIKRRLAALQSHEFDERELVTGAEAAVWVAIFLSVMVLCWIVLGLEV